MIKDFVERNFSKNQRRKVRNFLSDLRALFIISDLNKLAHIYKTDKWGEHSYTPHYKTHLKKYRLKKINLLEIGVGGYEDPQAGGFSLRMWKKYFPFGKIYSLDIYDKSPLQEHRIKIYKGSQVDPVLLGQIVKEMKSSGASSVSKKN